MRVWRALLVVLAVSLALVSAARAERPTAVVSLGDSYISGEAGRWAGNSNDSAGDRDGTDRAYLNGTYDPSRVYGASAANGCHRSDVAEVVSSTTGLSARLNIACSGAVTRNIFRASNGGQPEKGEPPQADQLQLLARQYRVRLIVLSIGGNDLGFASIVQDCLVAFETSQPPCHDSEQANIDAKFPAMIAGVRKAIDEIRAAMREANVPSTQYRVIVQSYPSVLPRSAENRYPELIATRNAGGCPFYDSDSDWARDSAVNQISDAVKSAATSRGAQFLDLRDAFQGHEFCSIYDRQNTALDRPLPAQAEWGRFVGPSSIAQGDTQELFHPNAYGQQALGRCLTLIAAQTGPAYGCLGGANVSPAAMRLVASR